MWAAAPWLGAAALVLGAAARKQGLLASHGLGVDGGGDLQSLAQQGLLAGRGLGIDGAGGDLRSLAQSAPVRQGAHQDRSGAAVELVVTAFKENVDWIDRELATVAFERTPVAVSLYCKGPLINDARCIRLPNVGTEEYGYLTHIINHYDDLAPITVFAVGSAAFELLRCRKLHWLLDKVSTPEKRRQFDGYAAIDGVSPGDAVGWDPNFKLARYITHMGGQVEDLVQTSVHPLGPWFATVVGGDLEKAKMTGSTWNGIFAASAESIRSFPKSRYEAMLQEVERCGKQACVVGHYMERAWKPMFAHGARTNVGNETAYSCPRLAPASSNALLQESSGRGHGRQEPPLRRVLGDLDHPPLLNLHHGDTP